MSQNYITKTELVDTLEQDTTITIKIMSKLFDIPQFKLRQLQQGKFPPRTRIPMGKYAEMWESEDY